MWRGAEGGKGEDRRGWVLLEGRGGQTRLRGGPGPAASLESSLAAVEVGGGGARALGGRGWPAMWW